MRKPISTFTAIAFCSTLAMPAPAAAQDDDAMLAAYQLTMANVRKMKTALDEIEKAGEDAPEKDDDETFAETIKKFEANPRVSRALKAAGISARDFILTLTALVGIALTAGIDPTGNSLPQEMRGHFKFLKENEKELTPIVQDILNDDDSGPDGTRR